MNINSRKTKEMITGPTRKQTVSPVMISEETLEQATSFKLLGVTVTDSLRWGDHVAAVTAMASKRLWLFKKLKRAGVPQSDLVYYYEAVIRPVMEYASPVWDSSLTSESRKHLKQFNDELVRSLLEAAHTAVTVLLLSWTAFILDVNSKPNKKLSYRRGTARCVVSIETLPIASQQCRNYLYDTY